MLTDKSNVSVNRTSSQMDNNVKRLWKNLRTVKNFYTVFDNSRFSLRRARNDLRKNMIRRKFKRKLEDLPETWSAKTLAQHRTEGTNGRVDARSWPGSRRLAAARKLASSSQSAWLGASSLLRGLETPKRAQRRASIAHPPRERVSSGEWHHRGKRCQIFGSLRRLKVAQGAFDFWPFYDIDGRQK